MAWIMELKKAGLAAKDKDSRSGCGDRLTASPIPVLSFSASIIIGLYTPYMEYPVLNSLEARCMPDPGAIQLDLSILGHDMDTLQAADIEVFSGSMGGISRRDQLSELVYFPRREELREWETDASTYRSSTPPYRPAAK
ncbi:hypothetical protein CIHG_08823 [Coccidioides immitis H538.4]|uniref:Uncharacterized protein n=3 Tax=Coccidioides immitis TaxID=5501 RepID=A0A0J8R1L7_COCIT|nr:hypothetical protein CIRG_04718 [Coccidioides immitis RMSCC 2394]KMU77563.1 hypothetical protein CISG_01321 [Coccidioides immitis RMSCC 3703]KMU90967.1 hypothetical protein CIHG_08823 [Coccidioides immitis H538.4]